jgi:hypothetical protein
MNDSKLKEGTKRKLCNKTLCYHNEKSWRVSLFDETQYKHMNHQKVLWVGVGLEGGVGTKTGELQSVLTLDMEVRRYSVKGVEVSLKELARRWWYEGMSGFLQR